MKRILLIIVAAFFFAALQGQDVENKVETKFYRPSITYLFIQSDNNKSMLVLEKMKDIEIEIKFDDHRIDFQFLKLPKYPQAPGENATAQERLKYNQEFAKVDSTRKLQINSFVAASTNPIVGKWFSRDASGNMSFDLVGQRGINTATDADAVAANASQVDSREMLGYKLINKTYVLLWDITQVLTMEQVYDAKDAKGRGKEGYKPVERTEEGYVVSYTVRAFKMDFNDSVNAAFFYNYWVDEENHDRAKSDKWSTATFPINQVAITSGTVSSTQPKDPNSPRYKYQKKKTMDELILETPTKIQADACFNLSKKIEDFRVKAPVFKTDPLSAKLGTKEALYFEQRFFIYEIGIDKEGNQEKIRKGVARVKTIANNDTIAVGETEPSVFRQQGGKKLYEGMLMESMEDIGTIGHIGYLAGGNKAVSGVTLGVEYMISKSLGKSKISGLYFGLGGAINMFKDKKPGNVRLSTVDGSLITNLGEWSGTTMNFWANFTKEIYLLPQGNFYLAPSLGIGFSAYSFSKYDGELLTEYSFYDEDNNAYTWGAFMYPVKLGLGINLHPNVTFQIQPGFSFVRPYTTSLKDSSGESTSYTLVQTSSSADVDTDWAFDKIDTGSTNFTLGFILKIRL